METTINATLGQIGKKDGMDRAERAADPAWWAATMQALIDVAREKQYFHSDDIVLRRRERGAVSTHEPRAMGPLMRQAHSDMVCSPTDRWTPSAQSANHRRPVRVWRSMIYQERR